MNEPTGKAASCLAITEKKAQRPGGCVGIFFQLFDWNRRFAKKMLFSKKMLPPARAKQTSKKFGGNEKLPKTKPHLIADENSGGFPNAMKNGIRGNGDLVELKQEMQAPGLVARLMGLESLPTVHREKHRKASNSAPFNGREERFVDCQSGSIREDINTEKGNALVESRPQKLQKTGKSERRTVTRFGTEALQIKGVLSRSKKSHHAKLTSPVKSPRISASRNASRTSRLIDAATRILEPGLQATNRAKCAITYSTSVKYARDDDTSTGGMPFLSGDADKKPQNSGSCDAAENKSFMGQASCRNCGNLLDVVDSETTVEKPTFVGPLSPSITVSTSSQGSEKIKPRPLSSSTEQVIDAFCQKNSIQHSATVGKFQDNAQPSSAAGKQGHMQVYSEPTADESLPFQERQARKQLRSQQCKFHKNELPSIVFKDKILAQNEMRIARDRTAQRARLSNLQNSRAALVTGALASKRNLGGRPRASTKTDNLMVDDERRLCQRQDDSLPQVKSPIRKRRTINANAQVEGTGLGNIRQRSIKRDVVNGTEPEHNGRPMYHTRAKSRSASHIGSNRASSDKNNEVISFTFDSPSRQKTSVSMGLKERIDQIDKTITCHRKLVLDENDSTTAAYHQNCLPLTGDALSMLLEQKLRELTSQEEDELTSGDAPPKKSAATILQELISAFTSSHSEQPNSPPGHTTNANTSFLGLRATSLACSHDGNRLSPGSVLEASFSNDSCISSSVDDSPGMLVTDSADDSYGQRRPLETDFRTLDFASSSEEGNTGSNVVIELLDHISRILQSTYLAGGRLTGSKLFHAKEVILNAELLFGTASSWNSDRMKKLCVSPSLLDELETLGAAMWMNLNSLLFLDENKGSDQLRRFLFDCVIEFLDSKYGRYRFCGFKAWRRVPASINPEILIREMEEEVRRWVNLVGMIPDEIILWEMSHSLGKWTDFEAETFETGAQIDWEILQTLMDEIVTDFWN